MSERNIKLTIDEDTGRYAHRQTFVISIGEHGVEIRREGSPVVSRDSSVATTVGREPTYTELVLRVEEQP